MIEIERIIANEGKYSRDVGGYIIHNSEYGKLAKAIEQYVRDSVLLSEDLIKELKLLKSYFDDRMEVVLHKNDIKWDVIDKALQAQKLKGQ